MVAVLAEGMNLDPGTLSNSFKDWLPSMLSIVIVVIGGFMTYLSTIKIEQQKRQYDLKKEVYFEILGSLVKVRRQMKRLRDTITPAQEELKRKQKILARVDDYLKKLEKLELETTLEQTLVQRTNELNELTNSLNQGLKELREAPDNFNDQLKQEYETTLELLQYQQMKLELCASKDINKIYKHMLSKYGVDDEFFLVVYEQLIPALRADLINEPKFWWEFWK